MNHMTTAKQIAQNTIIQVMGKALTIAVALIGFGLMTRYLGQTGYGYFSTVYGFLTIFGILVDMGLQMTATQLISDPRENESQILGNALTIRLLASLVFLAAAPLLVFFFNFNSDQPFSKASGHGKNRDCRRFSQSDLSGRDCPGDLF